MVRLWVIVGGLLLVLVGAAFLAPSFIEWERYRDRFEAEASALTGREVRVGGISDARLLPFPSVTFEDVTVAGEGGEPALTVERFSFDAELAPFLRGEILVFDARLDAPTLDVALGEGGELAFSPRTRRVDPGTVTIEQLTVTDGTVRVADATGASFEARDVDLTLAADTLLGPWRAAGTLETGGERFTLDAATGLYEPALREGVRLTVTLNGEVLPAPLTAFGTASIVNGAPAWDGQFQSAEQSTDPADRPFVLTGTFEAVPDGLSVPQYRLALGTSDDPYVVNGEGELRGGLEPGFTFLARGQRLDTARLGEADGTALPARLDALRRLALNAPRPGVDGLVDVSLPAIVFADTTVRDVRLRAVAAGGDWRVDQLALALPGRTSVEASGRLAADGSGLFEGDVALRSLQPTGVATWLGNPVTDALRELDEVALTARLAAERGVQRVDDLAITLGDERITGSATLPGDAPLNATLRTDALDLDAVQAVLVALAGDAAAAEASVALVADAVSYDGIDASDVTGRISLEDGTVGIEALRVGALLGARVGVDGTVVPAADAETEGASELAVRVEAGDPVPLLDLLAERVEGEWTAMLAARADEIGPLDAALDLAWLDPRAVGFEASADAGPVSWTVGGSLAAGEGDDAPTLSLADANAEGEGPAGAILRQLGVPAEGDGEEATASLALERTPVGSRLDASGAIPSGGSADTVSLTLLRTGEDALADLRFEIASLATLAPFAGLDWSGIEAGLDGRVEATRTDGLWTLGLEEVQLGGTLLTGSVLGEGTRWQGEVATGVVDLAALVPLFARREGGQTAIGTDRLPPLDLALAVEMRALEIGDGLVAEGATAQLVVTGGGVSVDGLEARLAGGRLAADASLRETLGEAIASGRLTLTDADVTALGLPGAERLTDGTLTATGTFEATGDTLGAMLASATGAGEAVVVDPVVEGLDPFALRRIYERVDASLDTLDGAIVEAAAREALPGGRFTPPALAGEWTLSGGTLRAQLAEAEDEGTVLSGTATVDLARGKVDARATLRLAVPDDRGAGGSPVVRLRLEDGEGSVDVGSLTGFLNLRAFEIERDRVATLRAALLEEQRLRRETLLFAELEREAEREETERREAERAREEREAAERAAAARREAPRSETAAPSSPTLNFDLLQ